MKYTEFYAALKSGNVARCYLFEGEEEYIKRSALLALRTQVVSGDFAAMNDAELTNPEPDALIAAAETLPFMADKRLIVVRECELLDATRSKSFDEGKAIARLEEYLPNMPDTVCVVFFVRGKADGRRKFYQLLKKEATIISFDSLDDAALSRWIAQTLQKANKKISAADCQLLWFTAGRDLNLLSCELEKLIAYVGESEVIDKQAIEAICTRSQEFKVFDMATALLSGDAAKAFEITADILQNGEDRLFLLSLLGGQCRRLYYASSMQASRMSQGEIASRLGVPSFALSTTLKQAARFTPDSLHAMCDLCIDTEYAVKNGDMNDEGSLESVMLKILAMGKEKPRTA